MCIRDRDNGAMEGKEVRLGAGATALWSIVTTVTSNGSVNGMHEDVYKRQVYAFPLFLLYPRKICSTTSL